MPGLLPDQRGKVPEHLVADIVSVPVVDPLEVIDVQRDGRKRLVPPRVQAQRIRDAAAVVQAGQGIGERLEVEPGHASAGQARAAQQRALETMGFDVPGRHGLDPLQALRRRHQPGLAGQLDERAGDRPGKPPDEDDGQHEQRNAVRQGHQHQAIEIAQRCLGGLLRHDAPPRRRHRRIAGQHVDPVQAPDALRPRMSQHHFGHRRVRAGHIADIAAVRMVDDRAIAIDDIDIRTVAIVVMDEDRVEEVLLVQIDRAADIAQQAPLAIDHGMGQEDEQPARRRPERPADLGNAGIEQPAAPVAAHGFQLQAGRRSPDDRAVAAHDDDRVEAAHLLAQPLGLFRQPRGILHVRGQEARAIGQLLPRDADGQIGRLGQLGRIDAVGFQRIPDQQIALRAITGIHGVRHGQQHRTQGQQQNQSAQPHPRRAPGETKARLHRHRSCRNKS